MGSTHGELDNNIEDPAKHDGALFAALVWRATRDPRYSGSIRTGLDCDRDTANRYGTSIPIVSKSSVVAVHSNPQLSSHTNMTTLVSLRLHWSEQHPRTYPSPQFTTATVPSPSTTLPTTAQKISHCMNNSTENLSPSWQKTVRDMQKTRIRLR